MSEKVIKVVHDKTTPITLNLCREGLTYDAVQTSNTGIRFNVPYQSAYGWLKIRAMYYALPSQNGNATLGIKCTSDSADFRLFAYGANYSYFDCGSNRVQISNIGYNDGFAILEIGNNFVINGQSGAYVHSGTTQSPNYYITDNNEIQLEIGKAKYNLIQVLTQDDVVIANLSADGDHLHDSISNTDWSHSSFTQTTFQGLPASYFKYVKTWDGGGATYSIQSAHTQYSTRNNKNLESITNSKFFIDTANYMFCNAAKLTTVDIAFPQLTAGTQYAFSGCSALTNATVLMPSLTRFGGWMFQNCKNLKTVRLSTSVDNYTGATYYSNTFSGCSKLEYVEFVGTKKISGSTQALWGIPTTAPCRAYRYVDDLGDGSCRLVFTSTKRPTYNITTKAIAFMADGIHYVSQDGTQELVYEGYGEEDNPINIKMTGSTILDANSSINYVNGVTMEYVAVLRITNDDNNQRLPIQIAYNGNTYNIINYSETKTIKFYNNSWVILD